MIHDVGKIKIRAEISNKPGKLNILEFEMIKEHPIVWRNLFTQVDFWIPVSEIIYQHQERLDGSGYPLGIKGDDILLKQGYLQLPTWLKRCAHTDLIDRHLASKPL